MSSTKQVHSSALTASDATQLEELGLVRFDVTGNNRGAYVYVQAESSIAKGNVVGWFDSTVATAMKVTTDYSDLLVKRALGVGLATISKGHFCYIQFKGLNTYVSTDASAAAASLLQFTKDMRANLLVAGAEHLAFATAMKVDSGSVCPLVMLYGAY